MGNYFSNSNSNNNQEDNENSNNDNSNKEKEFSEHFSKAQTLHNHGNSLEATKEIEEAIKCNDKVPSAYILSGLIKRSILISSGNGKSKEEIENLISNCLSDFNKAIELSETEPYAFLSRGITYSLIGDGDRAISDLTKTISITTPQITEFENKIKEIQNEENSKTIKNALDKCKQMAYGAYLNRANIYFETGKTKESAQDFSNAILLEDFESGKQEKSIDPGLYIKRGKAYLKLNKYGKAIEDFTKAIKRLNKHPLSQEVGDHTWEVLASQHFNRGSCYLKKKEFGCALTDMDKAVTLFDYNPTEPASKQTKYSNPPESGKIAATYYNGRGEAYLYSKQIQKAMSDFDTAVKIDSNCLDAFKNRGTMFKCAGNIDRAMADYNRVIEISRSIQASRKSENEEEEGEEEEEEEEIKN